MKFSVERDRILSPLMLVKTAVPGKAVNPILKTIFMEAKDGMLLLRGTNNNLDVSVLIPADITEEGAVCADGFLLSLMPHFDDGSIEFSCVKKLVIKQGDKKHMLSVMDVKDYPKKRKIKKYQTYEPNELLAAFDRTAVSLGVLPDFMTLQGFHINPHDEYMVTADGIRASLWENLSVPGNITAPKGKTIMPFLSFMSDVSEKTTFEVSLGVWSGLKVTEYSADDTLEKQTEMIIASLDGEFPDSIRPMILEKKEAKADMELTAKKDDLKSVLTVCNLYYETGQGAGSERAAYLERKKKDVFLSINIPTVGEMSEKVPCKVKGKGNMKVPISPKLLLEAVVKTQGDIVLKFFKAGNSFVMLDKNVENYAYIQATMMSPEAVGQAEEGA